MCEREREREREREGMRGREGEREKRTNLMMRAVLEMKGGAEKPRNLQDAMGGNSSK